jgi:hypothetical protein
MRTEIGIRDPDAFYAALVAAHEGLSAAASSALNARLVLLLANQVADDAIVLECIEAAKRSADSNAS